MTDRTAQQIFTSELTATWSWNEATSQDYGVDYFVQVIESFTVTGVRFGVQLKGIAKPSVVGDAIHFPFPTSNLGSFMTDEHMPIFLVVADTTKGEAYFQFLQGFADSELDERKWPNQGSVTIKVPLENRVRDHERLRRAVLAAREHMLAMNASPDMVLRRQRQYLEKIDPRFLINARATTGEITYELRAKEPLRFRMSYAGLDADRRARLRKGQLVPVTSGEIVFSGMPILERFADRMTGLQIAKKLECTATVEIESGSVVVGLANMAAKVTIGLEEMSIVARYANAPIDISVTLTPEHPDSQEAAASVRVEHTIDERWIGRRVDELPHFERLFRFVEVSRSPYNFRIVVHIPNEEDFEVPWGGPIASNVQGQDLYVKFLESLRLARATCDLVNARPTLTANVLANGFGDLEGIHALLTAGEYEGDGSRATFNGSMPNLTAWAAAIADTGDELTDFETLPHGCDVTFDFLNEKVRLPVGELRLTRARCSVEHLPTGEVMVRAQGTEGSRFHVRRTRRDAARTGAEPYTAIDGATEGMATPVAEEASPQDSRDRYERPGGEFPSPISNS